MSEKVTHHVGNGPSLAAILLENFSRSFPACLTPAHLTDVWGVFGGPDAYLHDSFFPQGGRTSMALT